MNGLGEKTEWLCGKAEDIFGGLPEKGFEGGKSCVVVDVSSLSVLRPIYSRRVGSRESTKSGPYRPYPYSRLDHTSILDLFTSHDTSPHNFIYSQYAKTQANPYQPPRKGCDPPFLTQLLAFQPLTIVYVSCNVHTQARDVGWLLKHSEEAKGEKEGGYVLESLRGFDLFPQVCLFFSMSLFPWRSHIPSRIRTGWSEG